MTNFQGWCRNSTCLFGEPCGLSRMPPHLTLVLTPVAPCCKYRRRCLLFAWYGPPFDGTPVRKTVPDDTIVHYLVEDLWVDVDEATVRGMTALHYAAKVSGPERRARETQADVLFGTVLGPV